jgi:Secretion system C-terminal sorting domain
MKHLRILLIVLAAAVAPLAYSQALNPGPDQGSAGLLNQNEGLKSVKLYPNPSIEYLSVKFETPIAKRVKLNVHNIIGSEMPLESEVIDDFELHVKVKDFSAGVYLLSIRNDETGHKSAFKFLKK